MKRGEVWWIAFGPAIGGEIQKSRPAIIVSNDSSNANLNRVQVVPITAKTDRVYPSETIVTLRGKKQKAVADQLATVAKARLDNRIAKLSRSDMRNVDKAIKIQLGLLE